jgi:hypothetical protein
VKLPELKRDLGILTLEDLKQAGLKDDDIEQNVQLAHTNNDYNKKRNEVTWVASANTDDLNLVIITSGLLYTKKQQKNTGREVEVGRIYVDEAKAEMILDALLYAFPSLLESDEDEDEEEDDEICDTFEVDELRKSLPSENDYELISVDPINKAKTLDGAIGNLKKCIRKIEKYQKRGYELLCQPEDNLIALSDEIEASDSSVSSDDIINFHNKIKQDMGNVIKVVTNTKTQEVIYISSAPGSNCIKLLSGNIKKMLDQGIDSNPGLYMKTIDVDEHLVGPLVEAIQTAFEN